MQAKELSLVQVLVTVNIQARRHAFGKSQNPITNQSVLSSITLILKSILTFWTCKLDRERRSPPGTPDPSQKEIKIPGPCQSGVCSDYRSGRTIAIAKRDSILHFLSVSVCWLINSFNVVLKQ